MKLQIMAFGIARDILKGSRTEVETPPSTTVGELKQILLSLYPELEDLRSLAIAVNEEYREDKWILGEKDEIVLIPPVSGG
jgi:molybdopterin converting factor subunit 1